MQGAPAGGWTEADLSSSVNAVLDKVEDPATGLASKLNESQVQAIAAAAAAAIADGSPEALDTLVELAAALGNDPNFATTVMTLIGQKAAASHSHSAGDITSGTLAVARGGTGRTATVDGSFLVGSGAAGYQMLTPVQVLTSIGAAAASHTHEAEDVDGLITEFSNMQEQLMNKVNSYPGQMIVNWAGTQAAYDALPTSEKYAAGFVAAIF